MSRRPRIRTSARRPFLPPRPHIRGEGADASAPLLPRWLTQAGLGAWALIGIVLVVSALVFAISQITPVFIALFIALLLTAILNPLTNILSRWVNRWIAVLGSLLAFVGIFAVLMSLVVSSIASQWPRLTAQLGNGLDIVNDLIQRLPFEVHLSREQLSTWSTQALSQAQSYLVSNWSGLLTETLANVSSVALVCTVLVLALFTTIFFLHSGHEMWAWFVRLVPARRRDVTTRAAHAGWSTFSGYARGTMIVAGTDGLFAAIFLQILGVPVAPALGILVFIGAFIPLIGAPAAMIIAMLVALASAGLFKAALVGVGIALIGQFEGHILQPLIMGHQVSLHPVVVGIGIAIGTFTAGLLGAIIAIPCIGVLWAIFSELYTPDASEASPRRTPSAR